jgi:PAS domain S-box-containing protein
MATIRTGLLDGAGRVLLGLLLAALAIAAPAADVRIGSAGSYPLSHEFSYLIDPSQKLTLDDIAQPATQARFRPLRPVGSGPNFGFDTAAFWLRVSGAAAAGAPRHWLLEVAYPPLDHLELYVPGPGGYAKQEAGDHLPFSSRAVAHRNHVLPVTLAPGESTLYLRIQSEGAVIAPVTLWQERALWHHDQLAYSGLSLYFGLLAGLLVYNLLLFASIRDRVYLLYVAFVAGMALFQLSLTGIGLQFLWPGQRSWNIYAPAVGSAMASTFALLFARTFLSSAVRTPLIDRLMLLEVAGFQLALAVMLFASYTWSNYMLQALVIAGVVTLMAAGAIGMRKDHPGARNFVIAWTVLLLGVLVLVLHNMGVLPSNQLTANAVVYGSALEMVLLSFALADRVNVARRFKEQAQSRIAAEQALVQALSTSQEQLKATLKEREVILDNSIAGIAFLTPLGRLRWANPTMLDMLGAKGRQVDSMERFYLSREHYLEVGHAVAEAVKQGRIYEAEMQIRRLDGRLIWISLSGKGVVLERNVQGTVWVVMDITRRKQLEEDLKAALAEHRHPGFVPTAPSEIA